MLFQAFEDGRARDEGFLLAVYRVAGAEDLRGGFLASDRFGFRKLGPGQFQPCRGGLSEFGRQRFVESSQPVPDVFNRGTEQARGFGPEDRPLLGVELRLHRRNLGDEFAQAARLAEEALLPFRQRGELLVEQRQVFRARGFSGQEYGLGTQGGVTLARVVADKPFDFLMKERSFPSLIEKVRGWPEPSPNTKSRASTKRNEPEPRDGAVRPDEEATPEMRFLAFLEEERRLQEKDILSLQAYTLQEQVDRFRAIGPH